MNGCEIDDCCIIFDEPCSASDDAEEDEVESCCGSNEESASDDEISFEDRMKYNEVKEMLKGIDLWHAFNPDEKVVLKNGKAAIILCKSDDGSFKVYECISEKFGKRGIIISYKFGNDNNLHYLDESCERSSAKIMKLENGDALLSLLQGVGTGVYLNKLFVLHLNSNGYLIPFEIKIDDIFRIVKKKTNLNFNVERKIVTFSEKEAKNRKLISFFLPNELNNKIKFEKFKRSKWIPDYSRDIIEYDFQKSPKVNLVVALNRDGVDSEDLIGKVSFDFAYKIDCKNIFISLSNPEIVEQY